MSGRVPQGAGAGRWRTRVVLATWVVAALLLGEIALGVAGRAGASPGSPVVALAVHGLLVLVAMLSATAGAMLLVVAHHPGSARVAAVGWGLVALAAGYAVGPVLETVDPDHPSSMVGSLVHVLCALVCVAHVAAAMVGERPRVVRGGAVALGVPLVAVVVLVAAQHLTDGALDGSPALHVAAELANGAVWLALAAALVVRARPESPPCWRPAIGAALVMALAHLVGAADGGSVGIATLVSSSTAVVAAVLVVRCSWTEVRALLRRERHLEAQLRRDLTLVRQAAADQAVRLDGVAHDARNACAGVRAAVETLSRFETRLDAASSAHLRQAAILGVAQLELVLGDGCEPQATFDLGDLARDLATARRAAGTEVSVRGSSALVCARPGAIGRVLLNLIVNAEVHGAGSPVVIEVRQREGWASATVRDHGPGVPSEIEASLFAPRARGADSPGQGLGLHLARSLARAEAGDVVLVPSDDGAAFVLSLPVVATAPPAGPPRTVLSTSRDRRPFAVG